jgi:N-acetylmuramoyl-L-alanine amidase
MTATDLDILARTIWGEARNQPWEGQLAVGSVVLNRVRRGGWWGATIAEVCHKPYQFSCYLASDPNAVLVARVSLASDAAFRQCLAAAAAVVSGLVPDPTQGATHYHTKSLPTPRWAEGRTPTISIGAHRFYKDIG